MKLRPSTASKLLSGRQKVDVVLWRGDGGECAKPRPQRLHGSCGQARAWLLGVRAKVAMHLSRILVKHADE